MTVSGFQLPSACCCAASHCWVRCDQFGIDVVNLRHVVEFHQAVGGENLVGRRVAEPREAAAGNFESQQPLIAIGDEAFGFGMHLGRQLFGALHVIERQHIGISAGRSLLEAAARHAQDASMPSITWLSGPGYRRTKILLASGHELRGKVNLVLHGSFQAAVEDHASARVH